MQLGERVVFEYYDTQLGYAITRPGVIADLLPANVPLSEELYLKYYGPKAPMTVLRPHKHTRLVMIASDTNNYLVIPLTPHMRGRLWVNGHLIDNLTQF